MKNLHTYICMSLKTTKSIILDFIYYYNYIIIILKKLLSTK